MSVGDPGASWESLGRSWGDLGTTIRRSPISDRFLIDLGQQKGAKRNAFGRPKGAQIDPKTSTKRHQIEDDLEKRQKHFSRPSWSHLRSILGHLDRAWGHLGAILGRLGGAKSLIFLRIFNIFEKSRFYMKKGHLGRSGGHLRASWGDLGASWAELGPIWAAMRAQKGGQKGPKRRQKRDQNDIEILIDFWIDFFRQDRVT